MLFPPSSRRAGTSAFAPSTGSRLGRTRRQTTRNRFESRTRFGPPSSSAFAKATADNAGPAPGSGFKTCPQQQGPVAAPCSDRPLNSKRSIPQSLAKSNGKWKKEIPQQCWGPEGGNALSSRGLTAKCAKDAKGGLGEPGFALWATPWQAANGTAGTQTTQRTRRRKQELGKRKAEREKARDEGTEARGEGKGE